MIKLSKESIFRSLDEYYSFTIREDLIDDSKSKSIGLTIERSDGVVIHHPKSYFPRSYVEVSDFIGNRKTVKIAKWLYDKKRKEDWDNSFRIHTG